MRQTATAQRKQIGKYEVLERIGAGGMAEVFRAKTSGPHGFERHLVIKRMHKELQRDKTLVQMFADEAKLAACGNHPNVVQVYELAQDPSGEMFMVMEHVAGTDLKELQLRAYRNNKRIPAWFSVYVTIEMLDGLSFMFDLVDGSGRRRNVIHRDVSPENIFVSEHGEVKIGDFGIARDDTRESDAYGHEVKGKTAYLAPEALSGVNNDQRLDVFSAGVVLWECLTQRPLFGAMTQNEMLAAIVHAPRVPPSSYVKDVPQELDAIVLSALSADPEDRIATTREMRAVLARVLNKMHPARIEESELRAVFHDLSTRSGNAPDLSVEIDDDQIIAEELEPDLAEELDRLLAEESPTEELEDAEDPEGRTYAIIRKPKSVSREFAFDARA
jgi:serine/threonine-protein kinase